MSERNQILKNDKNFPSFYERAEETRNIKKFISSFINSLFEEDNAKIIKSSTPIQNKTKKKIKKTPQKLMNNKKSNKLIVLNKHSEIKEISKSLEKVKNLKNTPYDKNYNKIILYSNQRNKKNPDIEILAHTSYDIENKNKIYKNIINKTENNTKTPLHRQTIGEKKMKEDIAKEKKMCSEKLRIIKDHILSLQRKEEELAKKMKQLNYKESTLNNNYISQEKNNEDKDYPSIEEENNKKKDYIIQNKKVLEINQKHNYYIMKNKSQKEDMRTEEDKLKEKLKRINAEREKLMNQNKEKGKYEKIIIKKNSSNKFKLIKKLGKTPEKNNKNKKIIYKLGGSNSKAKLGLIKKDYKK